MRGLVLPMLFWPLQALAEARGILFPWVPVFLACGIGLWFGLLHEPGAGFYLAAALVVLACTVLIWLGPEAGHPVWVAIGCVAAGLLLAGARAHLVAAPVLDFRYYGPVQGRIIGIDRSQSDALRLTLDRLVLQDVRPARLPVKVRISLHGPQHLNPEPGQIVQLTAHLSGPEGPVEPGGFDFRRMAWFLQLGAVGYARTPVMLWSEPAPREQLVNRMRSRLSAGVQAAIPGDAGAFAAGVMTGDRSGLSLPAVEALRASSLAHLLAISGMNMAFLTGFVFGFIRTGVALVPPVALRVNAKKIAAVIALGVAFFYLLLSGSNVATERAFLMISVMLGAVLLDRRALSLRSVALSAVALLAIKPESLLDAGFQMSFAATTALIAGFGALEGGMLHGRIPRWVLPLFTLVLSSALAGVATAPFGAAHFNRIADFGFVANLLTVPVMGAVVMPAGALAALLAPIGLAAPALWVMGLGCEWILAVAHLVAGWEGAVTAVPAPGPWVLPLIAGGGIWLSVWRGWLRGLGLVPLAAALAIWANTERPLLLIAPDAGLVGLMGPEGRALPSARGAGFAARSWLENDGDLAEQATAANRPGFSGPPGGRMFQIAGLAGVHLKGKGALDRLDQACRDGALVIIAAEVAPRPADCHILDRGILARSGGLAVDLDQGQLLLRPANSQRRIWAPDRPRKGRPEALLPAAIRLAGDQ
ncbi:MAG: ComEC/Rec2 family competence protein [Gemmobacter sp.]|nr:ComEC/Rec2 family competence protein [Gemmobacter sp.]